MKKLTLFLLFAGAALIYSCSKDQAVVKNLEGTWKVESVTIDGVADTADYSNDTYTFEVCKVKNGACPGKLTTVDPSKGEVEYSFTYTIEGDGSTIKITMDVFGIEVTTVGNILENSDSKFSWSETGENGEEYVYVLVKS